MMRYLFYLIARDKDFDFPVPIWRYIICFACEINNRFLLWDRPSSWAFRVWSLVLPATAEKWFVLLAICPLVYRSVLLSLSTCL